MTMATLQGSGFDQWLSSQDAGTRELCLIDQVGLYAAYLTGVERRRKRALVLEGLRVGETKP